jgi:hypothetical protein
MFMKLQKESALDKAIDRVLDNMEGQPPDSEDYAKMVNQLVKLHSLKVAQTPKRVSNDTLAIIAANIVGLVLVLYYERTDAITTRAVNFIKKLP